MQKLLVDLNPVVINAASILLSALALIPEGLVRVPKLLRGIAFIGVIALISLSSAVTVIQQERVPSLLVESTWLSPELEVGHPRALHITLRNTTGRVLHTTYRSETMMVKLVGDFAYLTAPGQQDIERELYRKLSTDSFGAEQDIPTANGGTIDHVFQTRPLDREIVRLIRQRRIVLVFAEQTIDFNTHKMLYEACIIAETNGDLVDCMQHNT